MLKPWWKKFPGRLEHELQRLKEDGISCEPEFMGDIVSLNFPYYVEDEKVDIIIKFPPSYPYLRFTVDAPNIVLAHHHNPFNKDLCILGRATVNWETDDTVADTLKTQLPKVLRAGRSTNIDEVIDMEENQPEPISTYFETSGFIFINGKFCVGKKYIGQIGDLEIGIEINKLWLAVLNINDINSRCIANANPHIARLFNQTIHGRWIRLDQPIIENNPILFFNKLIDIDSRLRSPKWQKIDRKLSIDIIAVIFPEENKEHRILEEGWLFHIRFRHE
jgi:hypothetical protein